MMQKTLMAGAALLALTALPLGSVAAVELRLGHNVGTQDARHVASEIFKERLEELTNGEATVRIFPAGMLGQWREMQEGLELRTLDIVVEAIGTLERYSPLFGVELVPFLYNDRDHFIEVWTGDLGEAMLDTMREETGFRLIGLMTRGPRHVTAKRPIARLEDFQGLRIRTPDSPTWINTFRALGASPTPMDWGEVFTALETGVIDAQENPWQTIYYESIHEVAPYITLSGHIQGAFQFQMWDARFQELPANVQEAIYEAAAAASDYYNEFVGQEDGRLMEKAVEEGATVIELDDDERARWREAVADVRPDHPIVLEWIEQIRADAE